MFLTFIWLPAEFSLSEKVQVGFLGLIPLLLGFIKEREKSVLMDVHTLICEPPKIIFLTVKLHCKIRLLKHGK